MSRELKFPIGGRDAPDEELGRVLAPLYVAPGDEAYWDDLHARIMRRVKVATEEGAWWVVLSGWARAGAAAAVLAAALAGALLMQHRANEARLAYEDMLNQSPVYSMHSATRYEEPVQGDRASRADRP